MKSIDLSTASIKSSLQSGLRWLSAYRILLFFVTLSAIYGFLIYRINVLNSAEPDQSTVATQKQSLKNAHIDQATIDRIQQLQDNSVNVQTLFDQARQNPFQE